MHRPQSPNKSRFILREDVTTLLASSHVALLLFRVAPETASEGPPAAWNHTPS